MKLMVVVCFLLGCVTVGYADNMALGMALGYSMANSDKRSDQEKREEYEHRKAEDLARDNAYVKAEIKNPKNLTPKQAGIIARRKEPFDWDYLIAAGIFFGIVAVFVSAAVLS